MAVDGWAWAGLGLDVGINLVVGKVTGGLGPVKQGVGDIAGGFGGAVVADALSNGPGVNNLQAGIEGAGFALLGTGAGQLARAGLRKSGAGRDAALTEAQTVSSTASDQAKNLEKADTAVSNAEGVLDQAQTALNQANGKLQRAQERLNRNPGDPAAENALERAEDAQDEAATAFANAQDDLRIKRADLVNARNAHPALKTAADNAEAAMKSAEKRAKFWGQEGRAANWVKPVTLGGVSMAHVTLGIWEYGDEGGGPGAGLVPLEWAGQAAAAAGGVAGKAPFLPTETNPGVIVTPGPGFLLRPQKLTPELVTAFGGASGSFAATVVDIHQMSGDLEKKIELRLDPAPRMPKEITVGSGGGANSYNEATDRVEAALDKLYESELGAKETAAKVEEISATVKDGVAAVISSHNDQAQQLTDTPDLDRNFMKLVSQGFDELIAILETAANSMGRAASGIEDPSAGDENASKRLSDRVGALENSLKNPGLLPDGSKIGTPETPGLDNLGLDNLGVGTPNVPGTSSSDLDDATKQMQDRANDALQASTPDVPPVPSSSLGGIPAAMTGAGGMMGPNALGSLIPTLLSQAAMRKGADSDLARRVDDIDPSRYDVAAAPTMPPARPAATTPWSNPAPTTPPPAQPAHHQSGPPSGATSNQTGSGMPKRVPGADGLVVYPFPDGRTQKITLTRALGLDNGFANKSGTDAQAAYAKTPAAFADHKDIEAIDAFQLSTGDVVLWRRAAKEEGKAPAGANALLGTTVGGPANDENLPAEEPEKPEGRQSGDPGGEPGYRTALLVVFGDGESGTVEAIVQGELQPFDPELADADGRMGEFAGFKRPNGLDDPGAEGQDTETVMNPDQPMTDMPALAAPA